MKSPSVAAVLGLAATAHAHMEMTWPYAFRSKYNPNVPQASIDYSMTSPLDASGSNYPCKGYHSDYDSPAGKSVVAWQPGQTYNWTLAGSAVHGGGSCQVSLSYDRGSSWTVIHSYIGSCPLTPTWSFKLPDDTPTGDAIFAWSWWNNLGNREMYQNCAHVTIAGASAGTAKSPGTPSNLTVRDTSASTPFASRPAAFVANAGNGCGTVAGKDVLFPNPGPDVDTNSAGTAPPTGSCASKKRFASPLRV